MDHLTLHVKKDLIMDHLTLTLKMEQPIMDHLTLTLYGSSNPPLEEGPYYGSSNPPLTWII